MAKLHRSDEYSSLMHRLLYFEYMAFLRALDNYCHVDDVSSCGDVE
jgi:hypothetical protein